MRITFLISTFSILVQTCFAQNWNSVEIYHEIEKLKSPYRVLYLAAHPDDENTRLISYFANEVKASTAYLSLTRGDGGQNLIGKEKGALLGVLRTEELMSARRIDGGRQFFSRAVDFGYSKTTRETFEFWGKQEILSDVVYILRYFKPHIVINRFPTDNTKTHGHHQASAHLSSEAFDKANNPAIFPEQVSDVGVWQPRSLFLNSSTWWDKSLPERAKNDFSITSLNIGIYNKSLGISYNEMAAESRSQHKSQGFGSAPSKGDQLEYLEFLNGEFKAGTILHEGLLDSIDESWLSISDDFDGVLNQFNYEHPENSVSALLQLKEKASLLNKGNRRFDDKIERMDEIILNCMGASLDLISSNEVAMRNDVIKIDIEAINRSALPLSFKSVECDGNIQTWNRRLEDNIIFSDTMALRIDSNEAFSNPYWLNNEFSYRFQHEQALLKYPVSKPKSCRIAFQLENNEILVERAIVYKWTDRVKGGLSKPLSIFPDVSLEYDKTLYFPKDSVVSGNLLIHNLKGEDISSTLQHNGNELLSEFQIKIDAKNPIVSQEFQEKKLNSDDLVRNAQLEIDNKSFHNRLTEIKYDHVSYNSVFLPSRSKIVPIYLPLNMPKIAYIEGPDNEMIDFLNEAGCNIKVFTEDDLIEGKLKNYDVLVFGIRSLNVDPKWNNYAKEIQEFIKNGGNVVMQYQTSGANPVKISPYSFEISRKRVTDENSTANITNKGHSILNKPFLLTKSDFTGWNQERGLYFADNYEENFSSVLSWHDKDELDEFGSLIIAEYGKGNFIYTGISFFRHIPYGVPGSYKLLINILSYQSK